MRQLALMTQQLKLHKTNPKIGFITRLKWAIRAFKVPQYQPTIELGGGVSFNLAENKLILPSDYSIECQGTLTISASEHLMLNSGSGEEERPGYRHAIWLNTEVDELGRPIKSDDPRYIHGEVELVEECKHG